MESFRLEKERKCELFALLSIILYLCSQYCLNRKYLTLFMMMRKITLVLFLLVCTLVVAAPVSREEARQKAMNFLKTKGIEATNGLKLSVRKARKAADTESAYYYLFNAGNENGYVVVSGDDRTDAILGYADKGSITEETMPDNMRAWLEGYADQLRWMEEQGDAPVTVAMSRPHQRLMKKKVAPLLTSQWNQNAPFNLLCPKYGGKYSAVGCVAVAMAQVMNYHKQPAGNTMKAIPAYKTASLGINVSSLPVTTFDWENMSDTYNGTGTVSDPKNKAVATLMQYAGAAVRMDYSPDESGSSSSYVPWALVEYFGYDGDIDLANRNDYTYAEWVNLIYDELSRGPVYYSGVSTSSAHAFVVDGYAENDYFHLNWGWGGMSDGYFKLCLLDPESQGIGGNSTGAGYKYSQEALVNMKPVDDGVSEAINDLRLYVDKLSLSARSLSRTGSDKNFAVTASQSVYNMVIEQGTFDFGYALYDGNNQLAILAKTENKLLSYYYGTDDQKVLQFGAGIAEGVYKIVPVSKLHSASSYVPSYSAESYYILVEISEKTATLTIHNDKIIQGAIELQGNPVVGKTSQVKATVKNNGDLYSGDIMLFLGTPTSGDRVSYSMADGQSVEIESGKTEEFTFSFTPKSTGSFVLLLVNEVQNPIAEPLSITVTEAAATTPLTYLGTVLENTSSTGNTKTVYGTTARFAVTLQNTGSTVNNDGLAVKVADYTVGMYTKELLVDASISPSQTTTVYFDVENLEYDHTYQLYYFDYNSDSHTDFNFIPKRGVNIVLSDGSIRFEKPSLVVTMPDDAVALDISSLTSVNQVRPNGNPNALYYVNPSKVPMGLTDKNVVKNGAIGQLTLVEGYDFFVASDFEAASVSYTRQFAKGVNGKNGWSTLVLPFKPETIKQGEQSLDWFHQSSDSGKDFWLKELVADDAKTLSFADAASFEANTPYLIGVPGSEWGAAKDLTLKDITFATASPTKFLAFEHMAVTGEHFVFKGSTTATAASGAYVLNADGNAFVQDANAVAAPFRAHFMAVKDSETVEVLPVGLDVQPDVNGIHELATDDTVAQPIFNLQGVRVSQPGKGLYIRGGKKLLRNR